MDKIIIFCQAPADIQYLLAFYEEHKHNSSISIYCVHVYGAYKFLKSLNLKVQKLVFIPYPEKFRFWNLLFLIKNKLYLLKIIRTYFSSVCNSQVYFFSAHYDWITFFILSKLSVPGNNIYYFNHYDTSVGVNFKSADYKFPNKIRKFIFWWLTGIKFYYLEFNTLRMIKFPYEEYGIIKLSPPGIHADLFEKYSVKNNIKENSVLYFDNYEENFDSMMNFQETTSLLFKKIKENGINIYLKPHPRIQYSPFLNEFIEDVIPDYIPGEFLISTQFKAVIGIFTSVLAYIANRNETPVYSLINLYDYKLQSDLIREIEYLKDLSNNIHFVESVDQLVNMIK